VGEIRREIRLKPGGNPAVIRARAPAAPNLRRGAGMTTIRRRALPLFGRLVFRRT
jgi:hypothetical protein